MDDRDSDLIHRLEERQFDEEALDEEARKAAAAVESRKSMAELEFLGDFFIVGMVLAIAALVGAALADAGALDWLGW